MESTQDQMTDAELVALLRRAAQIWFKNTDLLLLEELISRYRRTKAYANTRSTSIK